jgi:hypothetical protein
LLQLGGFEGVEVHGGNGHLLHSFLARKTNTRTDRYGRGWGGTGQPAQQAWLWEGGEGKVRT